MLVREREMLTGAIPGVIRTGVAGGWAGVVASTARPAASTQHLLSQVTQLSAM